MQNFPIRIPVRGTLLAIAVAWCGQASAEPGVRPDSVFLNPPATARPWVFWYWMQGAVSPEGITADLQAMHNAGLGGAYLMPIEGVASPPLFDPPARQLSPRWWQMVQHAAREAARLDLKLAMHLSDGFALAGGPWIAPAESMQQVVWSTVPLRGGQRHQISLPLPPTREGHYGDVAVLAFPTLVGSGTSTSTVPVQVTTDAAEQTAQQLVEPGNDERLRSEAPCTITLTFDEPFTCRSVTIRPDGTSVQCQRMTLWASDDGGDFRQIAQLAPPRHGWQDEATPATHAVPTTTAKVFRLSWTPEGSEPGAEDLDAAKWKAVLKVSGIELSSEPRIHHFRGKSGAIWRISPKTIASPVTASECIAPRDIIDLTSYVSPTGVLDWDAPPGQWTVLRIGHTSTGKRNATGGAAEGLECNKLDAALVRKQFEQWFGAARKELGPELAAQVLTTLHVDSWECGSQNWTADLLTQFQRRRGYDPLPYLPILAGLPVGDAETSERFLHDYRFTIAELLQERFFGTLRALASEHGCRFTCECVAPTMLSDAMQHFALADVPMGEFWMDSPTHDKPNDMADAISAAHNYGRPIVGAEAFTQLRAEWNETPALLKPLADRHYALGANWLVHHVFVHNPWIDRRPGMTLGGIGTYLQRDQVWWPAARGWIDYNTLVQAVLQQGQPVVDIAVWTGDDFPRRAILPHELVDILPGLCGDDFVAAEQRRRTNEGTPTVEQPLGVTHTANTVARFAHPDPLRGYRYDSLNTDALLHQASVENGRIKLSSGASYALLVIPSASISRPNALRLSPEVAQKLHELIESGAAVVLPTDDLESWSLTHTDEAQNQLTALQRSASASSGHVTRGPWRASTLASLGVERDLIATNTDGSAAQELAWTHRTGRSWDVYFVANQQSDARSLNLSLRAVRPYAARLDAVTGDIVRLNAHHANERTVTQLALAPFESALVLLADEAITVTDVPSTWHERELTAWEVNFRPLVGPVPASLRESRLSDVQTLADDFAGVIEYGHQVDSTSPSESAILDVGPLHGVAQVVVNGRSCGTVWTAPWHVDVTDALVAGENQIEINFYGTWRNRMIADAALPSEKRVTWTTGTYPAANATRNRVGLQGPVRLLTTP